MNWKTCSVEVEPRIGKRRDQDSVVNEICTTKDGMQKNGLTMFQATCYSSLVPRVHPSLLCAAGFPALAQGRSQLSCR